MVSFQQVAKSQDAGPFRTTHVTGQTHKHPVQGGLEQRFFNSQVKQAEPLPPKVNAQHCLQLVRKAPNLDPPDEQSGPAVQTTARPDL